MHKCPFQQDPRFLLSVAFNLLLKVFQFFHIIIFFLLYKAFRILLFALFKCEDLISIMQSKHIEIDEFRFFN